MEFKNAYAHIRPIKAINILRLLELLMIIECSHINFYCSLVNQCGFELLRLYNFFKTNLLKIKTNLNITKNLSYTKNGYNIVLNNKIS